MVFSHATCVLALNQGWHFAILGSSLHEFWVNQYASTLETRLRYLPSDCFETFPFPRISNPSNHVLNSIGETYHEHRRQIMLSRQEGLTATYNRFHNPEDSAKDIVRLRELHVEMDEAVASAYEWDDLELGHDFHETAQGMRFTLSESARREILSRLLKLNHERYEEEVRAGLHENGVKSKEGGTRKSAKGSRGKRKSKSTDGQMGLL